MDVLTAEDLRGFGAGWVARGQGVEQGLEIGA
jgi:hypothetical protein